ncbi:MAG: type II toxin-antitoxin system HicB family antitoxin [Merismopedia sp. SIO2A8]|nr:type II toxin-antitoxin system HicB family antitoxin [Merismopedia sp. SIO2A8]
MNPSTKQSTSATQYSMVIQWSDEDQLFLVTIPEFSDRVLMPCTHGRTREEAIQNAEEVIELYLESWHAEGEPIPSPQTLQVA